MSGPEALEELIDAAWGSAVAGVSRSTTIVAAYLMRKKGLTVESALLDLFVLHVAELNAESRFIGAIDAIAAKRPQIKPTEFFLGQLEMSVYQRLRSGASLTVCPGTQAASTPGILPSGQCNAVFLWDLWRTKCEASAANRFGVSPY